MSDELTYRCNDKKRFIVFVPVCRASIARGEAKCLKKNCGFFKWAALSDGESKCYLPLLDPVDDVKPIRGIKSRRKRR